MPHRRTSGVDRGHRPRPGAPGSAFDEVDGIGGMYAGSQPQNSNNPKSVARYDVARFQVTRSHRARWPAAVIAGHSSGWCRTVPH